MFSTKENLFKLPIKLPTISLVNKLTLLYTFTTVIILIAIGLFLYPTFNVLLAHVSGIHAEYVTIECYSKIIISLLFSSFGALVLGQIVARSSLKKIKEFEDRMAKISANNLSERIDITEWPNELTSLALQFNSMLDRLQTSFSKLNQFSADIAHELRTPLHNLQGFTELQLTDAKLPKKYEIIFLKYLTEFKQLIKLTETLLFLAKSDNGLIKLNLQNNCVRQIIENVVEFYDAMLLEKNISLEINGKTNLLVDIILFKRLISNILSNAINYTDINGKISIQITEDKEFVSIKIDDNGIGIEEIHLKNITDRFYRIDASRQMYEGHLGLGLSIAQTIVNLHKGKIYFQSNKGEGTSVNLLFNK